ncbi:hypothetical protein [Couchioplanes caeruleus]|uniref:Uncharacterized protein n=2 Tax=Couchioplanes caeruleus TaxID=56438 RepID=A0A1K0FMZ7_9ACTN|nr:hypothetical protein [Couchioplanes caeruleus]OJF14207.1 hypothetical protein BG844_11155 [Couchioplanes caeruleus subsp. caeruleus]ROP28333.1 hypothetical protein EDD30_1080 [Couchioplanes caeruleus]
MTRPPIAFEPDLTDVVTAVVIPMDGITRRVVAMGVAVELWDPQRGTALPRRLVRNLSGHHVLLNEPADQDLTFRVVPGRAGYRGPVLVAFNPAAEGISRVVPLERRPDADFADVTTLVRGLIVRSATPVAEAVISARPSPPAGPQFPATTDERGVFALAVHLGETGPVRTTLHVEPGGGAARDVIVDLERGLTHVFTEVIDLDQTTTPQFTHQIRP